MHFQKLLNTFLVFDIVLDVWVHICAYNVEKNEGRFGGGNQFKITNSHRWGIYTCVYDSFSLYFE